jgi:hypothetical protein
LSVLRLNDVLECDGADMECIFTVICNLVSKAQSPDEALAMADQIANKLTAHPIEKPALCLKMYVFLSPGIWFPSLLVSSKGLLLCPGGFHRVPELFCREW